jgi:hypothetical protein
VVTSPAQVKPIISLSAAVPNVVRVPAVVKVMVSLRAAAPSALRTPAAIKVIVSLRAAAPSVLRTPAVVIARARDRAAAPRALRTPAVVIVSVSDSAAAPVGMIDLNPIDNVTARTFVVSDQVIVAVPDDPAELRPVFARSLTSMMCPLPEAVAESTRSVNVATVDVWAALSVIFMPTPITIELFVPVVNAGITDVVVCPARSENWTVPSSVSVSPDQATITALDESPDVPVVTPDQDGEQLSADEPSAILENT